MATVQELIDEVREVIHDNVATFRWTDNELIDYCNAGIRQTVVLVPEANATESVETISNDIARQTIPSGGIKFIKIARNYADNGTTPEGVVRYVEKDALDTYNPDWEFDELEFFNNSNVPELYNLSSCRPGALKISFHLRPEQNNAPNRSKVYLSFYIYGSILFQSNLNKIFLTIINNK